MSILIKGMEMPQTCRDCPLEQPYDGYNCGINKKSYSWALSDRPSDCPLIPVPPHGDLIDRDALKENCMKEDGFLAELLFRKISNAHTIIPADKEGDTDD